MASGRILLPALVATVVAGGIAYITLADGPSAMAAPEAAAAATADVKIAEVDGSPITRGDVEKLYATIKQRAGAGAPPLDGIFWVLADQLVAAKLVNNAAAAEGLAATPDVQDAIKQASEQIVQQAYVQKLLAGTDNDALLKPAYDKLVASLKDDIEVRASHILVDSEDKAKEIIGLLNKGGDFAALAKKESNDPGSKDKGGDLGFFPREAMVPEFANAAFALEPGKVTAAPIKTQFGWHVIKVDERRPRKAPEFAEVKPQLLQEVQQNKVNDAIAALKAKAKVERFAAPGVPEIPPEAPAPKAN